MAEAEKKQYNLRSTKDTVHVPASIQMQNDSQFVQNLLHQNQHDSDSDSAESELNCSAVADDSDSDHSTNKQTHTMPSTSSTSVSTSATGIDSALQQQINVQILSQLSAINDRLNAIESTNSKKTSDPKKIKKSKQKVSSQVNTSVTLPPPQTTNTTLPDLHAIRQDHLLQKQVEDRLKQLASADATGTKIKSLRGGPVEVVVPNRVKWPHEFVLSGSSKERIQYDQLTTVQWVAGYCRILREERDQKIKDHMLDYLISLMDDAHDFSWDAAMASHAVLLCRMEQGEVKSYLETDKLDRIRRANAQRHVTSPVDSKNSPKRLKNSKVLNCTYFNQGTCVHTRTHETKGVTYRHVCSYCFQQNSKLFPHAEHDCRNKSKRVSKNE